MLHPIASEDFDRVVIHPDRDAHDQRPFRQLEPLAEILIQVHPPSMWAPRNANTVPPTKMRKAVAT